MRFELIGFPFCFILSGFAHFVGIHDLDSRAVSLYWIDICSRVELQDANWLLLYPEKLQPCTFSRFMSLHNYIESSAALCLYERMDMDIWSVPWTLWHLDLRAAKWSWFSVISSKRSSPQPAPAALVSVSDLLFRQRERELYEISCPHHCQRRSNKPILSA